MSLRRTKCTTTVSARTSARALDDASDRENAIVGGAALTEITELTVRATGSSPGSPVMIVTPAGWWRKAE